MYINLSTNKCIHSTSLEWQQPNCFKENGNSRKKGVIVTGIINNKVAIGTAAFLWVKNNSDLTVIVVTGSQQSSPC